MENEKKNKKSIKTKLKTKKKVTKKVNRLTKAVRTKQSRTKQTQWTIMPAISFRILPRDSFYHANQKKQ